MLCRQVYSRTEVSDRELKNRVRNPLPESKASNVARRLALWDTDVSAGWVVDPNFATEAEGAFGEGF